MSSSGNFCTWSPLFGIKDDGSKGITLSNGNCNATHSHNGIATLGTHAVKSGKWYWEVHYSASSDFSDGHLLCGWQSLKKNVDFAYIRQQPGGGAGAPDRYTWGSHLMVYKGSGTQVYQGGYLSSYNDVNNDTYNGAYNLGLRVGTAGKILQYAGDFDNNKLYFGIDNTWYSLANAGTGTDAANTDSGTFNATYGWSIESTWQSHHWTPAIWFSGASSGSVGIGNWGQDSSFAGTKSTGTANAADDNGVGDFYYSPPSGYLALSSENLPIDSNIDPAETDDNHPQKQFGIVTFTGDGSSRTISGLGFQPDLIWAKRRDGTRRHYLVDSSRGFTKYLHPEGNYSEGTSTATGASGGVTSATSDGFVIGGALDYVNASTHTYVGWCWRCNGGTTATNTDGTITSTVQVNQAAGLSIMQWEGVGGSNNQTIGHGLGAVPDIWIVKDRDATADWRVGLNTTAGSGFASLSGANDQLKLNKTDSAGQMWQPEGNFTATATTCNTPNNGNSNPFFNTDGNSFVAYLWRSIEGFSKFGLFEGNSDADGPFIYTGFRPRLVFWKSIDATENWQVRDTERNSNTGNQTRLYWSSDAAEGTASTASPIDFLSNGFKVRGSNSEVNTNTIAYGAWADVPFKYANTLSKQGFPV